MSKSNREIYSSLKNSRDRLALEILELKDALCVEAFPDDIAYLRRLEKRFNNTNKKCQHYFVLAIGEEP